MYLDILSGQGKQRKITWKKSGVIKYFFFSDAYNALILANRILPLMLSAAFLPHALIIKPLKLNIKSIEIPLL